MKFIIVTVALLASSSLLANAPKTPNKLSPLMAKELNQMRLVILGQVKVYEVGNLDPDQVQQLIEHYNNLDTSTTLQAATKFAALDETVAAEVFGDEHEAQQVVAKAEQIFYKIRTLISIMSNSQYAAQELGVDEDKVDSIMKTVQLSEAFAKALGVEMSGKYDAEALTPVYKAILDTYGDLFAAQTQQQLNSLVQANDYQKDYYNMVADFLTDDVPSVRMGEALRINEPNWAAIEFAFSINPRDAETGTFDSVRDAIRSNDKEALEMLMKVGKNPTKVLSKAAYEGNKQAALLALEHGADLNQALYDGQTLYESANKVNKFLIELGADANLALLNFARSYDYPDVSKKMQADK